MATPLGEENNNLGTDSRQGRKRRVVCGLHKCPPTPSYLPGVVSPAEGRRVTPWSLR